MAAESNERPAYFVLAAWCTATKTWGQAAPGRYDSPSDARRMAVERGIYRVIYVCEGRQCALEPFALVGDD